MDTPGQQVPFRIDLNATPPVVEIGGVDVADRIGGVTVEMGYGQPTTLTVSGHRPGLLEGMGSVVVEGEHPSPPEFLVGVDPDELERAVMAGPMECETMAANYLAVLLDMAKEWS